MNGKKCLVVINGDNFRLGGQATRTRGGIDSFKRQKIATESHINFFNFIKERHNIDTHVLINSYKIDNEYDDIFLSWYQRFLKFYFLNDNQFGSENMLVEDTLSKLSKIDLADYDFILFIRPDFYLKEYFSKVFNPDSDKVLYAHIDSGYPCEDGSIPYVCHSITYVPKRFFTLLLNKKVWNWHTSAIELINFVTAEDIDFFTNTLHLCCSSLDWNPIYSMVGRYENTEYKTPNIRYIFSSGKKIEANTYQMYEENLNDKYTTKIKES
jgi:hypothetical protein